MVILASVTKGVLMSRELSAIEPKRGHWSCVFIWCFRTIGLGVLHCGPYVSGTSFTSKLILWSM